MLNAQRTHQLNKYLAQLRRQGDEPIALFDIGTKAARVLIAPKRVPRGEWLRNSFYNDAVVANLGNDVAGDILLPRQSSALDDVAAFLLDYRTYFEKNGIPASDVVAVGTAIFRWIRNRDEVFDYLAERASIRPLAISAEREAALTQCSLLATYGFGPRRPTERADYLLLLDQGGGSLEISLADREMKSMRLASLDRLGTLALKYELDQLTGGRGGAAARQGLDQFVADITTKVERWDAFPELVPGNERLLIYGMGSALAACMPRMTNFLMHNSLLTESELRHRFEEAVLAFTATEGAETEPVQAEGEETELTVLYGVPVYLAFLRRLGSAQIRFAGYGLRYGLYLWLRRDGHRTDEL